MQKTQKIQIFKAWGPVCQDDKRILPKNKGKEEGTHKFHDGILHGDFSLTTFTPTFQVNITNYWNVKPKRYKRVAESTLRSKRFPKTF